MGAADSKLAFRNAVLRLGEDAYIPPSSAGDASMPAVSSKNQNGEGQAAVVTPAQFWAQFWTLLPASSNSTDDLFGLFSAADVRQLMETHPENVATLLMEACGRLLEIVETVGNHTALEDSLVPQVLNLIRLLTRVMPFVFEQDAIVEDMLGNAPQETSPKEDKKEDQKAEKAEPQVESMEKVLFWTVDPSPPASAVGSTPLSRDETTMAAHLLRAVLSLLFLPGFTLPADVAEGEQARTIIWEEGIGASVAPDSNAQIDQCRMETARLLLVLLSKNMYLLPESNMQHNPWAHIFLTKMMRKDRVLPLLCSLTNVICNYDPVGTLPYSQVLFFDYRENLVMVSTQLLNVLLRYRFVDPVAPAQSPKSPKAVDTDKKISDEVHSSFEKLDEVVEEEPKAEDTKAKRPVNPIHFYISRLHRPEDFEFLLEGFVGLLTNPVEASLTYLPNSSKSITYVEELLVLFWNFIHANPKFLDYVCNCEEVTDLTLSLLFHSYINRMDDAKMGMVRMCCFVLHVLSINRNFAVALNQPVTESLPSAMELPRFNGNFGDVLILSVYALITTTESRLRPMYESYLTILANVSPYLKSVNVVAANKLLSLFASFSHPVFLLANETNHALVFYFLDMFSNIIQYQYDGNIELIYEILRHKQTFEDLRTLDFAKATAAVEKYRASRTTTADASSAELSKYVDGESPVSAKGKETSGFVPTEEWFTFWHKQLPSSVCTALLGALVPQIDKLIAEEGATDEAILEFLESGTLVGVLPPPHTIFVRPLNYSDGLAMWVTSYLWGILFLRYSPPLPALWMNTGVRLFQVHTVAEE